MKGFIIAALITFPLSASAQTLTLERYLDDVKNKNAGYKGAVQKAEGAGLRAEEADLVTSPNLFLNGSWNDNQLLTTTSAFTGYRTISNNYSLGVSQQTPIGLQAKLSYNLNYTSLSGVNPVFASVASYYEGKPVLELTQSLWRNGFGRETRASQDAIEAQAKATAYSERFLSKIQLAEAEAAYWRLSMAREFLTLQEESYTRGAKLRDWGLRRAKLQLSDRSDYLQAEAGLRMRELDRQNAIEEEKNAARQFNSLRSIDSDRVAEKLIPMSPEALKDPDISDTRDDVRATEEGLKAAEAAAKMGEEKNRPTLEVFATLARNNLNSEMNQATSKSFDPTNPSTSVGVRFNMPLDIGAMNRSGSGYEQEVAAAQLKLQRKAFEQEKDKKDLKYKVTEIKKRLKMAQQFEVAQREKYFYEKERHNRGRTTTFLVLQFEQDLALAQLNRLRVQNELLGLVSQMKLYGGTP